MQPGASTTTRRAGPSLHEPREDGRQPPAELLDPHEILRAALTERLGDLDGRDRLDALPARDGKDARLVGRAMTPGTLRAVASARGSGAPCLLALLGTGDPNGGDEPYVLESELVRDEGVMRERSSVSHARPPFALERGSRMTNSADRKQIERH